MVRPKFTVSKKGKLPLKKEDAPSSESEGQVASTSRGVPSTKKAYLATLTPYERSHLTPRKIQKIIEYPPSDEEQMDVHGNDSDPTEMHSDEDNIFVPLEPNVITSETIFKDSEGDLEGFEAFARVGLARDIACDASESDSDNDSDSDYSVSEGVRPSISRGATRTKRISGRGTVGVGRRRVGRRGGAGGSVGRRLGRGRGRARSTRGTARRVARELDLEFREEEEEERAEFEEEEEEEEDAEWTTDPTPPTLLDFTAIPGLTCAVPTSPLGFLQLFLTKELLMYFMQETNDYAEFCIYEMLYPSSYSWSGCNVDLIAKYLGLRMMMGMLRAPTERMYWRRNSKFAQPCFFQTMSLLTFTTISKYFHAYNNRAVPIGNTDRLIYFRPVMDYLLQRCRSLYVPTKNLSLDEGMLPWKGRLSIKVYNPMKPDKYGIKFYFLCEAESGYVLDFMIYHGVGKTLREIVMGLLGRHLHKGYHVFMDNYYNSVSLTEELYDSGVHSTGTLRLVRGAPKVLQQLAKKKVPRNELHFRRRGNTFVICWQDTRLVSLITNSSGVATAPFVHLKRIRKQGRSELQRTELQRPVAIKNYIDHMGGVDRFDQMLKYYAFTRRTYKWTTKVLMYFLQICLYNAFCLYAKFSRDKKKLTLLQFQEMAVDALIDFDIRDWPENGSRIPRAPDLPMEQRKFQAPPPPPPTTPEGVPGEPVTRHRYPVVVEEEDEDAVDDPAPCAAPAAADVTSSHPPSPSAASSTSATSSTPAASLAAGLSEPSGSSATPAAVAGSPAGTGPSAVRRRVRHIDPTTRLHSGFNHVIVKITDTRQRRCRVCYRSGRRKDTTWQCEKCQTALCLKGPCFRLYHTRAKFWTSPPSTPSGEGQHPRPQQQ